MTNSNKIAGLVGPTIITVTLSEAMNFHIWAVNIAPVTHLNGTLLFVAGIAVTENATPLIVVHGGRGLDYEYLKPLKELSNDYRVVFL